MSNPQGQGRGQGPKPGKGRLKPSNELTRADYTALYGPTTRDRVRLADTDLTLEIEADWSGGPSYSGNEMIFGGGKVIRESMGMSHLARDGRTSKGDATAHRPVDTVITGALILDWWGVVKADIGIRDGRIAAIGKAYNPETMDPIPSNRFEMPNRTTVGNAVPVPVTPESFRSGRAPRSSPATGGSSPPVAWTPTFTSSAPRRSTRPWPRA